MIVRIALTGLAAAVSAPPSNMLDLQAFFTGRTHAENSLKIVFRPSTKLVVDSVGRRQGNEFIQTDTVHEGDKPVRTRVWRTQAIGPGRYGGTLSDATGPVDIAVHGNTVVIRYRMKGGLDILETMALQRDGKTLSNHVVAKKFGLVFAHVDGLIKRLD